MGYSWSPVVASGSTPPGQSQIRLDSVSVAKRNSPLVAAGLEVARMQITCARGHVVIVYYSVTPFLIGSGWPATKSQTPDDGCEIPSMPDSSGSRAASVFYSGSVALKVTRFFVPVHTHTPPHTGALTHVYVAGELFQSRNTWPQAAPPTAAVANRAPHFASHRSRR